MRKIIYKRNYFFEELCYDFLVKLLNFLVFFILFITIIIIYQNDKEIKELEKVLLDETMVIERERIGFEELIDRYINSLPLPKEHEIIETENIETYEQELSNGIQKISPKVEIFNTSAYCACEKCCGKTDKITKSGKIASQWHTIAAGEKYEIGTIIYIPSLSNQPNKGWFVVEDRGGAISNDNLDIYFESHQDALEYGRKDMKVYIYKP